MTKSIDEDARPSHRRRSSVLSEKVRLRLNELIRNRELAGGQVITEERLAETLGVSRTPLREALLRLEGEGMLQKNSGRSYMVRRVDFQEYMQSLKMRRIIEPEAAALSAPRTPRADLEEVRAQIEKLHEHDGEHTQAHWDSDDRIHRLFGFHSGNPVMFGIIEKLRVTTRLFEITDIRQRVEADYREHLEILDALSAQDPDWARRAVDTHIGSLIAYSLEQVT
jgi:DNA-binding GntR family transcriptional regulator